MNRLIHSPADSISIDGETYTINTHYANALYTWDAFTAYEMGDLSPTGYAYAVIENMYLEPRPPVDSAEALRFASEYLNTFSDKDGERKTRIPPIDIEQDSGMIYDAFLSMGVHLRREAISYEDFLGYLRELPEGCEYAKIMYLRQQWYDNRSKMTKEEKELCGRIGWDKIKVRNRRAEREQEENDSYFKNVQNRLRAERGLPPL